MLYLASDESALRHRQRAGDRRRVDRAVSPVAHSMPSYLITNVRILDGTGREPFAGAVRVEGPRIAEVTAGVPPDRRPPGAVVIDGRGATLMPGLIESHAHIGLGDMNGYDLTRLPPEENMLLTVRNARTMLDCGYTSAFSAAAPKPRLDVVLKREIEAGHVPGPRLLANGPEITVSGGTRRHQPAPPAALRDTDLRVGGRRAGRDPPRVPHPGARRRRSAEAESVGRPRDVQLSIGPDADDRGRGGRGHGDRAGGEAPRGGALPECRIRDDGPAPRHRGDLSRQLRRRARAGRAGGGARPRLRRPGAGPDLQPEPGRRPAGDPAGARPGLRARARGVDRRRRRLAQARRPGAPRRRLRLPRHARTARTPATSGSS